MANPTFVTFLADAERNRGRPRASLQNGSAGSGLHEQDEIEVEVIRKLVDSYFAIVQRNLQVAKQIEQGGIHFM
jgi:hypothetical protein